MKRLVVLLGFAVLLSLFLGEGALAFISPVSPLATRQPARLPCSVEQYARNQRSWVEPDWWAIKCDAPWAIPDWWTGVWPEDPTPTPVSQSTPVPFIPISPIIFHSPVATPVGVICVAPGMHGQIVCYEVQ